MVYRRRAHRLSFRKRRRVRFGARARRAHARTARGACVPVMGRLALGTNCPSSVTNFRRMKFTVPFLYSVTNTDSATPGPVVFTPKFSWLPSTFDDGTPFCPAFMRSCFGWSQFSITGMRLRVYYLPYVVHSLTVVSGLFGHAWSVAGIVQPPAAITPTATTPAGAPPPLESALYTSREQAQQYQSYKAEREFGSITPGGAQQVRKVKVCDRYIPATYPGVANGGVNNVAAQGTSVTLPTFQFNEEDEYIQYVLAGVTDLRAVPMEVYVTYYVTFHNRTYKNHYPLLPAYMQPHAEVVGPVTI